MTSKEKAEELFYKYRPIIAGKQFVTGFVLMSEAKDLTKQCALIAVDLVLNLCWNGNESGIKYWEEVKQEIEKL
jgi:hypothetical protein